MYFWIFLFGKYSVTDVNLLTVPKAPFFLDMGLTSETWYAYLSRRDAIAISCQCSISTSCLQCVTIIQVPWFRFLQCYLSDSVLAKNVGHPFLFRLCGKRSETRSHAAQAHLKLNMQESMTSSSWASCLLPRAKIIDKQLLWILRKQIQRCSFFPSFLEFLLPASTHEAPFCHAISLLSTRW